MSSEERRVIQSPERLERVKLYWPVRLDSGWGLDDADAAGVAGCS